MKALDFPTDHAVVDWIICNLELNLVAASACTHGGVWAAP
jgi:hypothetical protein